MGWHAVAVVGEIVCEVEKTVQFYRNAACSCGLWKMSIEPMIPGVLRELCNFCKRQAQAHIRNQRLIIVGGMGWVDSKARVVARLFKSAMVEYT